MMPITTRFTLLALLAVVVFTVSGCRTPHPDSAKLRAEITARNEANSNFRRAWSLMQSGKYEKAQKLLAELKDVPFLERDVRMLTAEIHRLENAPDDDRRQELSDARAIDEVHKRFILPDTYGETRVISLELDELIRPSGPMEKLLNKKVDFKVEEADIKSMIMALAEIEGMNIIADDGLNTPGTLTIQVTDVPLKDVLSYISRNMGVAFHLGQNIIWVTASQGVGDSGPKLETRIYRLHNGTLSGGDGGGGGGGGGESGSVGGDVDDLVEALTTVLEGATDAPQDAYFKIFRNRNILIIHNNRDNLRLAEKVIHAFDRVPLQVLIEARFVTIAQNDLFKLGSRIQNLLYDEENPITVGDGDETFPRGATEFQGALNTSALIGTDGIATLSLAGIINKATYNVLLEAIRQSGSSQSLSAPRVIALNNQEAVLKRVHTENYFAEFDLESVGGSSDDEQDTTLVPVGTPETIEEGTILTVTPSVGNNMKSIIINIEAEISSNLEFQEFPAGAFGTIRLPVIDEDSITTAVVVNSGETVVMGGMLSASQSKSEARIPILGKLPLVGFLFRTRESTDNPIHLLIFITATIIGPDGRYIKVADDE